MQLDKLFGCQGDTDFEIVCHFVKRHCWNLLLLHHTGLNTCSSSATSAAGGRDGNKANDRGEYGILTEV
jgi:hypothetical protein